MTPENQLRLSRVVFMTKRKRKDDETFRCILTINEMFHHKSTYYERKKNILGHYKYRRGIWNCERNYVCVVYVKVAHAAVLVALVFYWLFSPIFCAVIRRNKDEYYTSMIRRCIVVAGSNVIGETSDKWCRCGCGRPRWGDAAEAGAGRQRMPCRHHADLAVVLARFVVKPRRFQLVPTNKHIET